MPHEVREVLPPCPGCGDPSPASRRWAWQTHRSGSRGIREECAACGRFIRWSPKRSPFMDVAEEPVRDHRPGPDPQGRLPW